MKTEDLQVVDHLYFRFLSWSRTLRSAHGFPRLSPSESQLLEEVVLHQINNNVLSVRAAIGLGHLGSPATLHKRLRHLRNLELLAVQRQAHDRRTKYLVATPLALLHFQSQGQAMQKALTAGIDPR